MTASASPRVERGRQRERVYRSERKGRPEEKRKMEKEKESERTEGEQVLQERINPLPSTLPPNYQLSPLESNEHANICSRMGRIIVLPNRFAISLKLKVNGSLEECVFRPNPSLPCARSRVSEYLPCTEAHLRDLSIILKSFPFGNYAKRYLSYPWDKVFSASIPVMDANPTNRTLSEF